MSPRYALNWLHHLSATCSSALSSQYRNRGAAKRRPLHLEMLEDRSVPAVVNWTGAVDGNWNNAANWYNTSALVAVVPADGDELVFDSAHLTGNKVTSGLVNNLDSLLNVHSIDIANGSFSITGNSLNVQSDVTDTGAGDDTLGIGIFGSAAIFKSGDSNLTLAGNSGFTGDVTVTYGNLTVASDNALGTIGGVTTIKGSGRFANIVFDNVNYTTRESLRLGYASVGATGNSGFAGDIQKLEEGWFEFHVGKDSQLKLTGDFSGDYTGFSSWGEGTLILGSQTSVNGVIEVVHGRLVVEADGALGSDDEVTFVYDGGTLDFWNVDYTVREPIIVMGGTISSSHGDSSFAGTIEIESNWFHDTYATFDVMSDANLFIDGVISGKGGVRKIGFGQLGLATANIFEGEVSIDEGSINIFADGALGVGHAPTNVQESGTLTLVNVDYTKLEDVNVYGGTIAAKYDSSFGGHIYFQNGSNLVVNDTLTFYGWIDSQDFTLIGAGYVYFNRDGLSGSNPLTVANGGLGGTAKLYKDLIVDEGAAILPGAVQGAAGILEVDGSVTFAAGSRFVVEIHGAVAGEEYDQLLVRGFMLGGATLEINSLYDAPVGTEFIIVNKTNWLTQGVGVGRFEGLDEGDYIQKGDTLYRISYKGGDGDDVTLTVVTRDYFRTTIGGYDPSSATWHLITPSDDGGAPDYTFQYGFSSGIAVTGDWDGDGTDTIGIYNPRTATWFLRNDNSAGSPDYMFSYGFSPGIPVVGDWDGDGKDTIGIYDPRTAIWRLRNSNSAGSPDITFAYGFGSNPVVGNWDGVGGDGIGVYNANTATWYLRNTPTAGSPDAGVFAYGFSNVKPVTGDWNDDGVDGIGVWNKSTAISYLRETADAGSPDAGMFQQGTSSSQFVTGSWNPPLKGMLTAAGGTPSGVTLTNADLQAVLAQTRDWGKAPKNLDNIVVMIGDLPGSGVSRSNGSVIVIDRDAGGYGWFIDRTPESTSEFWDDPKPAGIDLFTAVMHELGYGLYLDPYFIDGWRILLGNNLPTGVRYYPFSDGGSGAILHGGGAFFDLDFYW